MFYGVSEWLSLRRGPDDGYQPRFSASGGCESILRAALLIGSLA